MARIVKEKRKRKRKNIRKVIKGKWNYKNFYKIRTNASIRGESVIILFQRIVIVSKEMVGDRVNFSFTEKGKLIKHGGITLVIRSQKAPLLNKIKTPCMLPCTDLKNVHPVVRSLFAGKAIREIPLGVRLRYFLESWKILTRIYEFCLQYKPNQGELLKQVNSG